MAIDVGKMLETGYIMVPFVEVLKYYVSKFQQYKILSIVSHIEVNSGLLLSIEISHRRQ